MGWFSLFKKDKQTSHEAEGAYVARTEESGPRGRGKRGAAKSANEPVDPVLPEKKRARRRLVGAIALALAVIIGLPMVLDSEPKPLAGDIAIQIPAKDKPYSASDAAARPRSSVPAEQALDQGEEIVDMSGNASASATAKPAAAGAVSASAAAAGKPRSDGKPADSKPATVKPAESRPDLKPVDATPPAKPEVKPEHKPDAKPEHKPDVKPDSKPEHKPEAKPESKPEHKPDAKPADAKPAVKPDSKPSAEAKVASAGAKPGEDSKPAAHGDTDAERAKALLDGRADSARTEPAKPAKYVVQVAALATQEKIDELQDKLRAAGITSHTQKVATESGTRTRIRVGPFADKEEATKMREKLIKLGLSGTLIPQ